MLYSEIIPLCSEIHTKHVNKAELYYRLRSYRVKNTVLCIYVAVHGTPNIGALQALRFTDISLLFYVFVINHLKTEIKLKYSEPQSLPCCKHTPFRL
jgi:hypothetical protein